MDTMFATKESGVKLRQNTYIQPSAISKVYVYIFPIITQGEVHLAMK